MNNMKITDLGVATLPLAGTEEIEIIQGTPKSNRRVPVSEIPGKVHSVNNKVGAVVLEASDVGADPVGTAATAVAAHNSAPDPHPQYLTQTEGDALYAKTSQAGVSSVNTKTGAVTLTSTDVGADPAGTATQVLANHTSAADPHSQYMTQSKSDARYALIGSGGNVNSVNGKTGNVTLTAEDLGAATSDAVDDAMIDHLGDADPHNQYLLKSDASETFVDKGTVGQPNGIAALDSTGKVSMAMLPDIPAGRKVTVANQVARLALTVHPDLTIAYQADDGTTWALNANADPSVAGNWTELGSSLAGSVNSFKGRTGNVVPEVGDYTAAQITETSTRIFVTPAEKTAWNAKLGDAPNDGKSYLRRSAQWVENQAAVTSVNAKTGAVVLTATDVGADPAGAASAAVAAHNAAADPHPQYLTQAEGDARYASTAAAGVTSVNTKTGAVTLTADDLNAQAKLVSGTNIKTLNGASILGAGDVVVGDVTLTGVQTLTKKTIDAGILTGLTDMEGSLRYKIVPVSALALDCSLGNYFTKTISANSSFTFSNVPSGKAYCMILKVVHSAGTISWPSSVQWPAGIAPILTAGKTHLFVLMTDNAGVTWRGAAVADYTS